MKNQKYLIIGIIIYFLLVYAIFLFEVNAPGANITSYSKALWYSVVTLTTVGYGDCYPVTGQGKILGLFVILGSLGILGILIGEVTYKFNSYMEKKKNGFFGTDIKEHNIIIGWNSYARQVANEVYNAEEQISLITDSKEDLEDFRSNFPDSYALFTDLRDIESYNKANIVESKSVFINRNNDADTLVQTINIRQIYPNINIIVCCYNNELQNTLISSGANHVVLRSAASSRIVASYLFEPFVADVTRDISSTAVKDDDSDMAQFCIKENSELIGSSFLDVFIKLRKEYNVTLVGMAIDGRVNKNVNNDYKIKQGDYIIVVLMKKCNNAILKITGNKEG